ncbi:MAG TPA: CPBP family intramembrane glutamic endopeptidase [Flexivirga sp.]|uniref:CPBP family intramembrane glutamic endopeptidase n=1 Tax=Flexivirga sp. TaxID=1962927 RepID=UPI002BFB92AB|nr:CPBP family intramembrane glutamic endopeptidase [Flexivirga sp.]HWC24685.1 CPBP family intramembrane glutamic endopeptidase [Flexivirga sp.]
MGGLTVGAPNLRPDTATAAAAATLAIGTPMLRRAIRSPRGGMAFRRRTVELAAVWTAGAAAIRLIDGRGFELPADLRAVVLQPAAVGAVTVGVFTAGALVGSRLPFVRDRMADVLDHARKGPLPTVAGLALLTGATEELFFRGALYDVAAHLGLPVLATTTALHMAVTTATGNPMLVLASGLLSTLTGLERARTGSVVAPVVLHVVWSAGMLLVLPPIVNGRNGIRPGIRPRPRRGSAWRSRRSWGRGSR